MTDELEGILNAEPSERDKHIAEATAALGAYAEVRDMVQLPGWRTFILELHRRAAEERKGIEDLLDLILVKRTPDRDMDFTEAKLRLLGLEYAIKLYVEMRERAEDAKRLLDSMPSKEVDSTQNG